MSYLSTSSPYQLLEINMISAQDLFPVSKSMKAYAVAWLHEERKLATQIDQMGHTNPTWNEKFVFRVDDEFLRSETSVIMIEIYSSAWLRDTLIGTVAVLVNSLLPPGTRSGNRKPKLRFVALQIRRPSGRPQGILNIGVTLLDSTMRSMPLYSELSTSSVGYNWDLIDSNSNKKKINNYIHDDNNKTTDSKVLTLQRCQSEKNDSTISDYTYNGGGKKEESLCSDIGPSPSVVAAAIAKGLYPVAGAPRKVESMNTKIENWRNTLPPAYDKEEYEELAVKKTAGRGESGRGKLFSCFGTAFGCEFSISCGGEKRKKKGRRNEKAHLTAENSELTYDASVI